MDAAHLAGVSTHVFLAAQAAVDPGPAEGVQLHRRGGVHRGAHHTRPASNVPNPPCQQGLQQPAPSHIHTSHSAHSAYTQLSETLPRFSYYLLIGTVMYPVIC